MPDVASEILSPLSHDEIRRLLEPLATSPDVFWVTTTALYGWCRPADIESALQVMSLVPIPRCLHGNAWNQCKLCPSVQEPAVAN